MTETVAHKMTSKRGGDCGMGDHMGRCGSCLNARLALSLTPLLQYCCELSVCVNECQEMR